MKSPKVALAGACVVALAACGGPTLDEVEALPVEGSAPQLTLDNGPLGNFTDMDSLTAAWSAEGSPIGYQIQYADIYALGWSDQLTDNDQLIHDQDQWRDRLYIDNPVQGAEACLRVRAVHEDFTSPWSETAVANHRGTKNQAHSVTCRSEGTGKPVGDLMVSLADEFPFNWFYFKQCMRYDHGECEAARSPLLWIYEYPSVEEAEERVDPFLSRLGENMNEVMTVCNYLLAWDSAHDDVSFDERMALAETIEEQVC